MIKNITIAILAILLVACALWGIISNARNHHAIRAVQAENYRLENKISLGQIDRVILNAGIATLQAENTRLFNLLVELYP